jgi:hypothetical protein
MLIINTIHLRVILLAQQRIVLSTELIKCLQKNLKIKKMKPWRLSSKHLLGIAGIGGIVVGITGDDLRNY